MAARKVPISEKTLLNIINEVKKRKCLWDLDYEFYNDRCKLALAWDQISTLLKVPEDVLRAKWKNLRDLFKREEKKYNTQSVDDYTGKWRHFKTLWFLHRSEPTDNTSGDESIDTDVIIKEEDKKEDIYEVLIENNICKRSASTTNIDIEPEKKMKLSVDYDAMFLQSLTPFFKELEPWRKLVVRNKIQDIILNEMAEQNNFEIPE